MNTESPRTYKAFISYSHSDEQFAGRIHRRLESYRTPRRLIGQKNRDGVVPPRLFPIFRDRDELPTSSDLGGAIKTALQNSDYLVVLCSPHAARSRWVNEEVQLFKQLHGEDRVIAVLLSGEPEEAFPQALKFRVSPDGSLTDIPTEPIAADIRKQKDGFRFGSLKVLAGLLGVNLDDLVRRDKRRQSTRRMIMSGIAGAVFLGALVLLSEWHQAREQEAIQADFISGANHLRVGAVFEGSARFLFAAERAGGSISVEDQKLAAALRSRLVPLEVALSDATPGQVFNWKGKTYISGQAGPIAVADDISDWSINPGGDIVIASVRGLGLAGIDRVSGQQQWVVPFESGWHVTGAQRDKSSGLVQFQTAYYGTTNGSSQSSGFWLDTELGEQKPAPASADGSRVNNDSLLVAVNTLAWPRAVDESLLWEPIEMTKSPWQLTAEDERRLFTSRGIDSDASLGELFGELGAIYRRQHYSCGEYDYIVGLESQGNSGGSWVSCGAKSTERFECSTHDFIGILSQLIPAPDCSMVVATGVNLEDQKGIVAAMPDGAVATIENAIPAGLATLGRFSPAGTRFAATDGDSVIQLFERTDGGLRNIANIDVNVEVLLLSFVGESSIAFVTASGELRAVDIAEGNAIWPPYKLPEDVIERLKQDDRIEAADVVAGRLIATAEGDRLALLVELGQEGESGSVDMEALGTVDHAMMEPGSLKTKPKTFARLFDATRGVPLGNRLPLNVADGPIPNESAWENARLERRDDGRLVLSFAPFGALVERLPVNSDIPVPLLTGRSVAAALTELP